MASFKICVRVKRHDGLYPVYIRVTHDRQIGYIKTDKCVGKEGLRKGEVVDPNILAFCSREILRYNEALNAVNLSSLSVSEIIAFLKKLDDDISFSEFARSYIRRMTIEWKMARNAKNYSLAIRSLELFMKKDDILCRQLTGKIVQDWITDLEKHYHRAKQMYPTCAKIMFKAILEEFNDYEKGVIRVKTNPFRKIRIPKADTPEKRALDVDTLKRFFSGELPPTKMIAPLPELSRDVAELVFCLAGINTADLYLMKKENLRDGVLCYHRQKTKKFRRDGAYMEIKVPERLLPLFDKYKCDDDYLFSFHLRHQDLDCFNINVNRALKTFCAHNGLPPVCIYAFRHSWATLAQNICGASTEEVGFALNHSSAHRITESYIKKDYSSISILNERVLAVVFND